MSVVMASLPSLRRAARAAGGGVAVDRHVQAQRLAERGAGIFGLGDAAPLQDRHDFIDEGFQLAGQAFEQVEAIGAALFQPELQAVGHLLGRADQLAARGGVAQRDLAQGQALVCQRQHAGGLALVALEAFGGHVARERAIGIIDAEIVVVEPATQRAQGVFQIPQFGQFAILGLGFRFGAADHRAPARNDEPFRDRARNRARGP
jgi:hypothetical protein